MAERRPQYPHFIFPSAISAALFIRENGDFPLDHIQYNLNQLPHRPNFFPDRDGELGMFNNIGEIVSLLDRTAANRHRKDVELKRNGPRKFSGRENFDPTWSTAEYMNWVGTREGSREAYTHSMPYMEKGWSLRDDGSWMNDHLTPPERQARWETAGPEWKPRGIAPYSRTRPNAEGIVLEVDEECLKYIRQSLKTEAGGNSTARASLLKPQSALYFIKLVLMQHGNRDVRDHSLSTYPQTELERLIARQQTLHAAMVEERATFVASGSSDAASRVQEVYLQRQQQVNNSLIDQLRLTQIVSYKLSDIDAKIKSLASDIEYTRILIAEKERELGGRVLNNEERRALCLDTKPRHIDILHYADRILQLAAMAMNFDASELHFTKTGQKVIVEEIGNAIALLKLYSMIDIYGGGINADMFSVIDMSDHDPYLSKLARSTKDYRLSLYEGRLFTHSLIDVPIEVTKRATRAFLHGIRDAILGAKLIVGEARESGVTAALSLSVGATFGRLGASLLGGIREMTGDFLEPELVAIEGRSSHHIHPTIPELGMLADALEQRSPRSARITGEIRASLAEASAAGLDTSGFRGFEIVEEPMGSDHYMYKLAYTGELVDMYNGVESLDEMEARFTRNAVRARDKPPFTDLILEETETTMDGMLHTYWVNARTRVRTDTPPRGVDMVEARITHASEKAARNHKPEVQQMNTREANAVGVPTTLHKDLQVQGQTSPRELKRAGSVTGILDQQDFTGQIDDKAKLEKELKAARRFINLGEGAGSGYANARTGDPVYQALASTRNSNSNSNENMAGMPPFGQGGLGNNMKGDEEWD